MLFWGNGNGKGGSALATASGAGRHDGVTCFSPAGKEEMGRRESAGPVRQGTRLLINNRQGGRRRGRGGQRPQGMSGRPDGNRQDNRQRGNAAQLLEKYKALARDMQLAGDRVQTEYYLQFADHYFRVLEEGRSRFEEQNQRVRRAEEDEGDEERGPAEGNSGDEDGDDQRPTPRRDRNRQDEPRGDRPQRSDRAERGERFDRNDRTDRPREERPAREERPRDERAVREEAAPRAERPARPRRDAPLQDEGDERISLGVLPPAIGIGSDEPDAAVEAPRPRRRVRKPREDGAPEDIAPAA